MSAPSNQPSYQPPSSSKSAKSGKSGKSGKSKRNVSVGQILAAVLLIVVVVFIVENTRQVPVRLIGPEVKAPLYIPILIAAVLGALIAALLRYRRQHKK